MYNIGSIILKKYLIFKYNKSNNKIDHAKFRPCLVIAEDSDKMYFLVISSSFIKTNQFDYYKIPEQYVDINKDEYVCLNEIYSDKICGYPVKNDLEPNDLYNLLVTFYNYHICRNDNDIFNDIKDIIKNEILALYNSLNNPKKTITK